MYEDFRIISINTDLKNKSISVEFTFDIDFETVDFSTVKIYDYTNRNECFYDYTGAGKYLQIVLKDWPVPNGKYRIFIQNIKNVIGETLVANASKDIIFNSSIKTDVEIVTPINESIVESVDFTWKETGEDKDKKHSYFYQLSKDNGFYDIAYQDMVIGTNTLNLMPLIEGQYYLRLRVENANEYGNWSKTITFYLSSSSSKPPVPPSEDNNDYDLCPIVEDTFSIKSITENENIEDSIIITFNKDVDPSSINNIKVWRRQI